MLGGLGTSSNKLLWNYKSPSFLSRGQTKVTWRFHVICTIVTQLSVCTEPESIVRKYIKRLSRSMPELQAHNDLYLFPYVIVAKIKFSYYFYPSLRFRRNLYMDIFDEYSACLTLKISILWGAHINFVKKIYLWDLKSWSFYGNMKVLNQWSAGTPYLPSSLIQGNLQLSLVWMYTFTCVCRRLKVKNVCLHVCT